MDTATALAMSQGIRKAIDACLEQDKLDPKLTPKEKAALIALESTLIDMEESMLNNGNGEA